MSQEGWKHSGVVIPRDGQQSTALTRLLPNVQGGPLPQARGHGEEHGFFISTAGADHLAPGYPGGSENDLIG